MGSYSLKKKKRGGPYWYSVIIGVRVKIGKLNKDNVFVQQFLTLNSS